MTLCAPLEPKPTEAGIPVVMAAAANNPPPPPPPPPPKPWKMPQAAEPDWSTDLFDCLSDPNSCCLVFWCPCVAFGRIAEIVDKGTSSCCCSGSLYLLLCSLSLAKPHVALAALGVSNSLSFEWMLSCAYRVKLKQRLNMPASSCEDCCTHFWCEPCALCQEYRELQIRGYDLSLGWKGNMRKRKVSSRIRQYVSAPVAQLMNR